MGNCQANDAVATMIEYPNGRIERLYWTISARQVMLHNPGYYVAVYIWPKPSSSPNRKPKMKILPPSAILVTGHYYRLVSYEEVLDNFSSRKIGSGRLSSKVDAASFLIAPEPVSKANQPLTETEGELGIASRTMSMSRQWRPSLHSISES